MISFEEAKCLTHEMFPTKGKKGRPSKMPSIEQLAKDYATMSFCEIAERYGVPISTVKSWVYRARRGDFDDRC